MFVWKQTTFPLVLFLLSLLLSSYFPVLIALVNVLNKTCIRLVGFGWLVEQKRNCDLQKKREKIWTQQLLYSCVKILFEEVGSRQISKTWTIHRQFSAARRFLKATWLNHRQFTFLSNQTEPSAADARGRHSRSRPACPAWNHFLAGRKMQL